MLSHIHQNYTQRLTLGTLARTLGRQSAYLGRLFRDEIGVTVHEYVTRARMVNGAVQVRSGVKIEAVALDLGYRSKKNFYRQFKRRFGMTPEKYRYKHNAFSDPLAVESSRDPQESVSRLRGVAQQVIMLTLVGSPIAMLVTDDAGRYVGANETAVCMTGYSVGELRGMPVEMLLPHVCGPETRCRLQILLPASSSLPTNTVLHTKSAGAVQVYLTSAENLLEDRQAMMPMLA